MNPPQLPINTERGPLGYGRCYSDVGRACDKFLRARGLAITKEEFRESSFGAGKEVHKRRKLLENHL